MAKTTMKSEVEVSLHVSQCFERGTIKNQLVINDEFSHNSKTQIILSANYDSSNGSKTS